MDFRHPVVMARRRLVVGSHHYVLVVDNAQVPYKLGMVEGYPYRTEPAIHSPFVSTQKTLRKIQHLLLNTPDLPVALLLCVHPGKESLRKGVCEDKLYLRNAILKQQAVSSTRSGSGFVQDPNYVLSELPGTTETQESRRAMRLCGEQEHLLEAALAGIFAAQESDEA